MADLTVTASEVLLVSGKTTTRVAQVAITAGQVVYKDTANANKANLCDADAEASAVMEGVALNGAAVGQQVVIALPGSMIDVTTSTFAAGVINYVSTTTGGLAPVADLGSGDYVTAAVFGLSTTRARVLAEISGVALA